MAPHWQWGWESGEASIVLVDSQVAPVARAVEVEAILDVGPDHWLLGVEILSLSAQVGLPTLTVSSGSTDQMRWSYDEAVDAFAVSLRDDGRRDLQPYWPVSVGLSAADEVVSIRLRITREEAYAFRKREESERGQ